ncbi:MAG: thioesterase family protein [Pseudomonadota bacterium]
MDLPFHTLLSAAQQRAAGLPTPAPLAIADIVHHDDLDSLDHVNNTRYFAWFERLRIRHMTHYGIGLLNDPASPRIVIRSGEVRFVAELRGGESYITTCHCTALRRTSMTLSQEIWARGTLRATFSCVMVLLTQDGSARRKIPDDIRARLIADGAHQQ